MPKLIVKLGTADARNLLDGEYDTGVIGDCTKREWMTIRRLCDLRPPEFLENFLQNDGGALTAYAFVILQREGLSPDADVLFDAPDDAIEFKFPELEAALAAQKKGGKKKDPPKPPSERDSSGGTDAASETSG